MFINHNKMERVTQIALLTKDTFINVQFQNWQISAIITALKKKKYNFNNKKTFNMNSEQRTKHTISCCYNNTEWIVCCSVKPKFHLARHVSTCREERVKPCCSNMADDKQAIVLACTSLVVFMLLHTQSLFVQSNEIN